MDKNESIKKWELIEKDGHKLILLNPAFRTRVKLPNGACADELDPWGEIEVQTKRGLQKLATADIREMMIQDVSPNRFKVQIQLKNGRIVEGSFNRGFSMHLVVGWTEEIQGEPEQISIENLKTIRTI